MRDYVPGDDPRRIVWRATARTLDPVSGTGRYLVRESEQGITDRVLLLIDTDRAQHSPGRPVARRSRPPCVSSRRSAPVT